MLSIWSGQKFYRSEKELISQTVHPFQATLRQEGLIGRLKSERSEPATATWDEVKDDNTNVQDENVPVKDTGEPSVTMFSAQETPQHEGEGRSLIIRYYFAQYSITCIQRGLKGNNESGPLQQVVFKCRFY